MAAYYVDFINNTDRVWTMAVYQTIPNSVGLDSVAWKKTTVPPSGESGVEWEITYLVSLANYKQTGGIGVYKASQNKFPIDLGTKWQVVYENGVQQLKPNGKADKFDHIVVDNVSSAFADIGVGMDDSPSVYKRNVLSGSSAQFQVTPTYYVGLFNDLVKGTVISSNVILGPDTVKFPDGQNKAVYTATLDGSSITTTLTYERASVYNYEQVQRFSRSIGSEFKEVTDPNEVQKGTLNGTGYLFGATLLFGTLTLANWAYDNQALIAQAAGVIIDNFSTFSAASRSFKVVGSSALACAAAMDAIIKAIKDNAPPSLLQQNYDDASLASQDVEYANLMCFIKPMS